MTPPVSMWRNYFLLLPLLALLAASAASSGRRSPSGVTAAANSSLQPFYLQHGPDIPGLYEKNQAITPVQGREQFNRLVLSRDQTRPGEQLVRLVQFYLTTCPDCQGFSPYFKRFVADVAKHWSKLLDIFVVNCNDDLNINLCWQENPNLIVPLVRWYTFPVILANRRSFDDFPVDLLNVAHRQYIEHQRRDLISLRHATLRFIGSTMHQLAKSAASDRSGNSSKLLEQLPVTWRQFEQLARGRSDRPLAAEELLVEGLGERLARCGAQSRAKDIDNFLILEHRGSFIGRTLVADWSNWTCSAELPIMIHYTNNFELLKLLPELGQRPAGEPQDPILFQLLIDQGSHSSGLRLEDIKLKYLASNETKTPTRPKRDSGSSRDRLAQPPEGYQVGRRRMAALRHQPASEHQSGRRRLTRREPRVSGSSSSYLLDAENINWAPPELYPGEESLRRRFNQAIASATLKDMPVGFDMPGSDDDQLGEIKLNKTTPDPKAIISPKDEDLSFLHLTDYYKALDEIVHKNILAKAQLDGYQVAASACFLHQLGRLFPFQGGSENTNSVARSYLELTELAISKELRRQTGKFLGCSTPLVDSNGREIRGEHNSTILNEVRLSSEHIERMQTNISEAYRIGLPASKHLKWSYCRGSSEYLRGHTCSLWILFHTLTVNELLLSQAHMPDVTADSDEQYRFAVDYDTKPTGPILCDPENPEAALLNATTNKLFVNAPQFVLADIINFVRFYLHCTNCASHFSCMVAHSRLDFKMPRPGDHLLWMWEAHNRVNLRTRATHSEDPTRPKHVFPSYQACPSCYLEEPNEAIKSIEITTNTTVKSPTRFDFESIKFNRRELISFLVARYRRSAIINNKLKIEDLFKRRWDEDHKKPKN